MLGIVQGLDADRLNSVLVMCSVCKTNWVKRWILQGMFNSKFNKWAKNPDLDLFPSALEADAEAANSWIYPNINNGVYRCGSGFVNAFLSRV